VSGSARGRWRLVGWFAESCRSARTARNDLAIAMETPGISVDCIDDSIAGERFPYGAFVIPV